MQKYIRILLCLWLYCATSPVSYADHTTALDILIPIVESGLCTVTAVNGATPAQVTVVSTAQCGIVNGSLLWINGINNTGSTATYSSLNIHTDTSTDYISLCRVAASVTGTTFTVKACDGSTNITNNGTYSQGGLVARGEWLNRKALPVGRFDGLGGYLDLCVQSSASGGCYETGRVERTALVNVTISNTDLTIKHADQNAIDLANYTLRCAAAAYSAVNASCIQAKAGILNTYLIPSASCDLSSTGCNWGDSSYEDAAVELALDRYTTSLHQLFDRLLTTPEKDALVDYLLSDYPWTKGGHGYGASTAAFETFKTASGTVSFAEGSTAITGSGTSFLSQVSVGDFIEVPFGAVYTLMYPVAIVTDNTHLTLGKAINIGMSTGSGAAYRIAKPWVTGNMGYIGLSKTNGYTTLCGAPLPVAPACVDYVVGSGGTFGGQTRNDPWHNHEQGHLVPLFNLALALSHYNIKARRLASDVAFLWYHRTQPGAIRSFGGIAAQSSGYHHDRMVPYASMMVGSWANSFNSASSPLGSTYTPTWWQELSTFTLGGYMPGLTNTAFETNGEGAFNLSGGYPAVGAWNYLMFNPLETFASGVKQFLTDWGYYDATLLQASPNSGENFGGGIYLAYLGNQPRITASRFTTPFFANYAPLAAGCTSVWTSNECVTDRRYSFIGRTGASAVGAWNGTGATLLYDMSSLRKRDHAGQNAGQFGPQWAINGHLMTAGDGTNVGTAKTIGGGNSMILGSEANSKTGDGDIGVTDVGNSIPVSNYASPTLGVSIANTTDFYKTAASITGAYRGVMFARPSTSSFGVALFIDSFASGSAKVMSLYYHFWHGFGTGSSGCGTLTAETCATFSSSGKTLALVKDSTTDARENTTWLDGTVATENASDTNFTRTSGAGLTGRIVNTLGSATSGRLRYVTMPTSDKTATQPNIADGTSGSFTTTEWQDASTPVMFLYPTAISTVNLTSASATISAANTLVAVTGLAPGPYKVQLASNTVGGCEVLTVTAVGHSLSCPGVGAGAMTVSSTIAPVYVRGVTGLTNTKGQTVFK